MSSLSYRSAIRPLALAKGGKVGGYGRCHFCGFRGVIVDRFPRRGYARGNSPKDG